jgi:hypothetical protein
MKYYIQLAVHFETVLHSFGALSPTEIWREIPIRIPDSRTHVDQSIAFTGHEAFSTSLAVATRTTNFGFWLRHLFQTLSNFFEYKPNHPHWG